MPYVVIPQPFPNSPLQTQFATEDEANARAEQMVQQAPKQPVYVAELKNDVPRLSDRHHRGGSCSATESRTGVIAPPRREALQRRAVSSR